MMCLASPGNIDGAVVFKLAVASGRAIGVCRFGFSRTGTGIGTTEVEPTVGLRSKQWRMKPKEI